MTTPLRARIDAAVSSLRALSPRLEGPLRPRVGVILGTGLGSLAHAMRVETRVPYADIPHFPVSTVESHAGELLFGRIGDVPCALMSGRVHYYEGYSMEEVTFPVRVLRALGAELLIISNAVGGMNPHFALGDLCVTVDHINLMGDNPLIGPNDDALGVRFPDMSEPYDLELVSRLETLALAQQTRLHRAVFVAVAGPNLETRAEYRFLRSIGADVVGMSLVPEAIAAVHAKMRIAALSVITDMCLPDALEPADISRILRVAAEAEPRLTRLVVGLLETLDDAVPAAGRRG